MDAERSSACSISILRSFGLSFFNIRDAALETTSTFPFTKPLERSIVSRTASRSFFDIFFTFTSAAILPRYSDHRPVLGMKLVGGTRKDHDASPSLDRIDPSRGYIAGNVVVISHKANRLKNDAGLAELEALVAWLKSPKIASDHVALATA